jgi:hypothetical protein
MLCFGPLGGLARGELLALEFAGVVESASGTDGPLGGRVQVGSPFSGRFTYDSSVGDIAPGDPNQARYESPAFALLATIGSLTVDSHGGANYVSVYHWTGSSAKALTFWCSEFESAGLQFSGNGVYFSNVVGFDDSLPVVGDDLSSADRTFVLKGVVPGGVSFYFSGDLTSAAIVPEPATLALLIVGTAVLAWRRTRSSRGRSHGHIGAPARSVSAGSGRVSLRVYVLILTGVLSASDSIANAQSVARVYVGTQGAGGAGKVYRWSTGTSWTELTPDGLGTPAAVAVMDLAFFNNQLWAGVQTVRGKGGGTGHGQVWVCTDEGPPAVWEQVGMDLDNSVMVLEVPNGQPGRSRSADLAHTGECRPRSEAYRSGERSCRACSSVEIVCGGALPSRPHIPHFEGDMS